MAGLFSSIYSVKILHYSLTFSITLDFGDTKTEKYAFYFLLFVLSYELLILSMSVLNLKIVMLFYLEVNYFITDLEGPLGLQKVYTIGT